MPEPLSSKRPEAEETLQFLKREEVRTMAKDIAKLHEQEAAEERKRIVSRAETKTKESKPILQAREEEPSPSLMPHIQEQKPVSIKAKTRSEKILVRVIVMGILLFILLNGLAFGYWYFTKKRVVEIIPIPQPLPEAMEDEAEQAPTIEMESPLIFFETLQEKILELSQTENLLLLLSGSLKEEYPQGFTRIFIRGVQNNAFLTTREFLEKASIAMPEPLLSLLKDDFMLFVYASPGRKRLGFIGELSQVGGVQDMVRSWETTLEQDTKALWEIVGQKGSAYAPFFRQGVYQNNLVRFQTFSVLDFGIVHTLFDTKLILATSFESATKAIDQIMQNR